MSTLDDQTCPACHQVRQQQDTLCPFCGLVYARYRLRTERLLQQEKAHRHAQGGRGEFGVDSVIGGNERRFGREGVGALPQGMSQGASSQRGKRIYVSDRLLESLLWSIADALEAGLTLQHFVQSPLMELMPRSLCVLWRELASQGVSFVDAFEAAHLLDNASVALLRVGEIQGKFPAGFRVVAQRIALRRQSRSALLQKLAYPVLLILLHVLIQPLHLLILRGISAYMQAIVKPIAWIGILGIVLFVVIPRLDPEHWILRIIRIVGMYIPPFRHVQWNRALATWTETLGQCLSAGLPLQSSLQMACSATQHPFLQHKGTSMWSHIQQGSTLGQALSQIPVMPRELVATVAQGEQSGTLDRVLLRLAETYKEKHRLVLNTTVALVGIAVLVWVFAFLILSIVSSWQGQVRSIEGQLQDVFRQFRQ